MAGAGTWSVDADILNAHADILSADVLVRSVGADVANAGAGIASGDARTRNTQAGIRHLVVGIPSVGLDEKSVGPETLAIGVLTLHIGCCAKSVGFAIGYLDVEDRDLELVAADRKFAVRDPNLPRVTARSAGLYLWLDFGPNLCLTPFRSSNTRAFPGTHF